MGRRVGAGPRRGPAAGALTVRRCPIRLSAAAAARPLLVLTVTALLAAACTSSDPAAAPDTTVEVTTTTTTLPPTTTTTVAPTTTTAIPTTTVTTLVTVGPGDAGIGGTVSGPAGPVDGATVRVERLVGRAVATADVVTTAGGSWQLSSILGGSYRVWAFKPPDLGQSKVEAFFLAANDRRTIDLSLPAVSGERIIAAVDPDPPLVGQQATLTVTVGTGRVDDQGRAVMTPRPGVALTLTPRAGIAVESAPQAATDGNGAASWLIRCEVEGASALSLTVGNGVTQVNLPPCGPPAAPVTTRAGQ